MFFGDEEIVGHVPASLIYDEHAVGIVGDVSGDFDQMLVHGMGMTPCHDEQMRLISREAGLFERWTERALRKGIFATTFATIEILPSHV